MKLKITIVDVNYEDEPGHPWHLALNDEYDVPDGEPVTLKFNIPWLSEGGAATIEITP